MEEDGDLISAMWRSLVPAEDVVEPSPVDYQGSHQMVKDITAYYTEPADHGRVHAYDEEQQIIVHHQYQLPVAEIETYSAAGQLPVPIRSELVHYAPDPGLEPIDYDWNQYVMANGYPEEVVKDADINNANQVASHSQAAAELRHYRHNDEDKVKIYRVPETMRKGNESSYAPQFMSIGPYHYSPDALRAAEEYKTDFLNKLRRDTQFSMVKCRDRVRPQMRRVKDCYEKEKDRQYEWLSSSWYASIEACFLLVSFGILPPDQVEVARRGARPVEHTESDTQSKIEDVAEPEPLHIAPDLTLPFQSVPIGYFTRDVCLLENQIPFFIMEIAYEEAIGEVAKQLPSLKKQVVKFVHKILGHLYPTAISLDTEPDDFDHILDYYHTYFKPSQLLKMGEEASFKYDMQQEGLGRWDKEKNLNPWRFRATDLKEVGIKFKNIERTYGRSLLDIKFAHGVLEIPTLVVDGQTRSLFRNIIAFEQKSGRHNISDWSKNYFTAYVKFMADLMTTLDDVTILTKKRIILNYLGKDEDVLNLFSMLMQGVSLKFDDDNYLMPTYFKLDKYYNSNMNKYMADIRFVLLKNPRTIVTTLAAIIAFTGTVVGLYFALKNRKKN